MKKWLLEHFLPMWAKETVLRDNRLLREENDALCHKVRELEQYIRGIHTGMRHSKRRSE